VISPAKVSIVILTHDRKEELKETVDSALNQDYENFEVVVIDNGSTDGTERFCRNSFEEAPFRYRRLEENRGVGGGRNVGIREANGEILVFIDDDAVFQRNQAIREVVDKFDRSGKLGAIAFKSLDYEGGNLVWQEVPLKDRSCDPGMEQKTSYYVGVGHAIRREVLDKVGLYSDRFFYGFEELDLSFRIMDAGYRIIYCPRVAVLHKNPATDKTRGPEYWKNMLENRIRTSLRNLPWRYFLSSSIIWSVFVLYESGGRIDVLWKAYGKLMGERRKIMKERKPISAETLDRVKRAHGRHLY